MRIRAQFRAWSALVGLALGLTAGPAGAQSRRNESPVPRPERHDSRAPARNDSQPRFQSAPEPPPQPKNRPYQPPRDGHHSGQWLNQHREQPLDEQKRALERDPAFRRLPRESQQRYEQRLQRFDSMPVERQQQVLRRMETWEHLTPQQKQEFRGLGSQFNSLAPERRQALRNAIETLRAMPPQARQREIQSGRFSQFSQQERQILNDAARLPLAPAPGDSRPEEQRPGSPRYVPRPPQ
ncbi:MAG: DUF3106 domain-containing protein [Acidobacteria bacterium]|nr:DUF3106 domain-containing protein [Acidobacteriota bacterium]